MKKSVRISLLVITTVVAIFAFAGIWYLRPGVPNELLEQARARQLQPLLEIEAPIRKPVAEAVTQPLVDKKALADELLPTLTEEVARSLEGPLYEKLKKEFASDEAFYALLSAKLETNLNLGTQKTEVSATPAIPQVLQADFTQQVQALRQELLATFGEGQSAFFYQVEGMLDARLDRFEGDLKTEMQAYVPQLVDRMIPTLVEMLVKELDANKQAYLPLLKQELQPRFADSLTEEDLVLLYTSYRDRIVADLVPAILAAMEEPAKEEVAQMVKDLSAPVPPPPPAMTSVVKPEPKAAPAVEPKPAPVVEAKPISTPPEPKVEEPKTPLVPKVPTVVAPKSVVQKVEPVIAVPAFTPKEAEAELFVDPLTYEQKRTEIRTKAIQEVLDRINAL